MEDPQPTVIDEHAGTNGFPLREGALYAPVAGVPSVPRVVGDSLPRAIAALRHAGLTATVRHVASLKPEGSVIVQNPEAGTKSSKGGSVRLDVSLQPLVAVPDVTGMRGVTAVDTLTRSRLVASIRYVPSSRPAR